LRQEALNRLYLLLLEIRLAALAAYPGRNRFQGKMIPLAVNMKRRVPFPHLPLAMHAFHEGLLILNSESRWSLSGTHAVMMAR
jgi:hypothetical protein